MVQRTLLIIKPDAIKRGLGPSIVKDVKGASLKTLVQKKVTLSPDLLARLYEEHKGKPFYDNLMKYMTSGPSICAVLEGVNCIERLRRLMGNTYPSKASQDSIRGKYRTESDNGPSGAIENMVHGSDGPARAKVEIEIIFGKKWAV